ncbi:NAD(P)/FAD-dependent oxidoreductase [Jatrophihabitans endophyticus]|uniref:flavin-containing monooxygenase n=1 Tax=Jatrophihabitans endophyticus TaxID=1206085 RepID=UPI0026EB13C6|nr:NAD(P)/FAD-dependent oxidoreductase [Jatrophihabitans endophyticus]
MTADQHVDVLIVGAGISGIGMACHLTRELPDKTYAVLERRQGMGGTWDLFRYPGVRSDSDMFTFGYNFRPWHDTKVLADGASIRRYVHDTADEYGVTERISFGVRVVSADWSGADARWTVRAVDERTGDERTWTAGFLVAGTGYYDYDAGYRPDFPGEDRFGGTLVHPQQWPDDLDHAGKKVVIIGSGATAVTLVPALAESGAEHVTMLQRSPTYIVSLPAVDKITEQLRRVLPTKAVYALARGRNIAVQRGMYALARFRPDAVRKFVVGGARKELAGTSDLANFTPTYEPWDQRLCVVPDGDLFRVIREGRADVVTDRIATFTETGIELESGRHLDADIVVTATGLQVQMLGGATLSVDGAPVDLNSRLTYKAVLVEGVPNFGMIFGYVNASWTLKADIAAEYLCRLMQTMDAKGYASAAATAPADERTDRSVLAVLNAGYVRRGDAALPRQGRSGVWKVDNNYLRDAVMLRHASVDDGVLEFAPGHERLSAAR